MNRNLFSSLFFSLLFLLSPVLGMSAIRVAPASMATISIESKNEKQYYKKRRFKFFQKLKNWFKKKDWIDDGGFGKLAIGCLVMMVIMLWISPPAWVYMGLLIGALIFALLGVSIGGENTSSSKGVLMVLGILGILAGLTFWYVSKRAD